MPCGKLLDGLNICAENHHRKYVQEAILINYFDVKLREIESDNEHNNADFKLGYQKKGHRFVSMDKGSNITGNFKMNKNKGKVSYSHSLDIPVIGIEESSKVLLKQLDEGLYFGVLKFSDGTIELFAPENGLKTTDYSYSGQSSSGGDVITLKSILDEPEPPMVYSGEPSNWDDAFEGDDQQVTFPGDYNFAYNNDYNHYHIFPL